MLSLLVIFVFLDVSIAIAVQTIQQNVRTTFSIYNQQNSNKRKQFDCENKCVFLQTSH